jgi:hypothetical protein
MYAMLTRGGYIEPLSPLPEKCWCRSLAEIPRHDYQLNRRFLVSQPYIFWQSELALPGKVRSSTRDRRMHDDSLVVLEAVRMAATVGSACQCGDAGYPHRGGPHGSGPASNRSAAGS